MGHYLEEHKLSGASKFLFEDVWKMAIISTFCVAGICPELPVTETLRRKKQTTLYQVTSEIDGILSGLVVGTYWIVQQKHLKVHVTYIYITFVTITNYW